MSALFKKLNLKAQAEIIVLNAPDSLEGEIAKLSGVTAHRSIREIDILSFALAFVTTLAEIETLTPQITQKALGDAVIWFAYPKASSRKYNCEFNRDTGWQALGDAGFEPVRQVSIDDDWSALRFRRVEYIKKLTRSTLPPMSEEGKARSKKD
jgi:hypothetical protein